MKRWITLGASARLDFHRFVPIIDAARVGRFRSARITSQSRSRHQRRCFFRARSRERNEASPCSGCDVAPVGERDDRVLLPRHKTSSPFVEARPPAFSRHRARPLSAKPRAPPWADITGRVAVSGVILNVISLCRGGADGKGLGSRLAARRSPPAARRRLTIVEKSALSRGAVIEIAAARRGMTRDDMIRGVQKASSHSGGRDSEA